MIAASEPSECVPHGRVALSRHPGSISSGGGAPRGDTSLLYKLTNFAIRDESLLEPHEEQAEWWCVRQAAHRTTQGLIHLSGVCRRLQECVPHGRVALSRHPGSISSGGGAPRGDTSLLYKLTNFAIRDESLLEPHEEQAEWWCVRQAAHRTTQDFSESEDSNRISKDAKEESTPDLARPTSRLKNEFNISIKSEILSCNIKKMDIDVQPGPSRPGSCNNSSNLSKKFNLTTAPTNKWNFEKKTKPINYKTDCCFEEELYVKGRTAVWSKGLMSTPAGKLLNPECRETIACYTCETPIKHAIFCNFHVDVNNDMLIDALNSQIGDLKKNIKIDDNAEHFPSELMPSIFIIDSKCMRVFAADGREYLTNIPFQVKKVWAMKYGALLEKDATPLVHNSLLPTSFFKLNESNNSFKSRGNFNASSRFRSESSAVDADLQLPTCFSLSHPLDEVTPVLMKSPSHGLKYYNDGDLHIIFVSSTPSIILVYDSKICVHSLWKIRKASRDECLTMCPNFNGSTSVFSQTCNFGGSISNVSTFGQKMQSLPKTTTSSWIAGMGSPYASKPTTPVMSRSRVNSPMANAFYQQGMSPHTSIGQASSTSMLANTMQQTPPALPLYPDICLDHIWTEAQSNRRNLSAPLKSTKSFLHTDLVGHDYLCYMLESSEVRKLQLMRLQKSYVRDQPNKTQLIVGAISSLQAKDAVVLDRLKMIAIIDETGNIILYSGTNMVGKVHVGGVLPRLIDSPYSKRTVFNSPFPRRSSLLPSRSNEAPVFDDSALHLLSPVPHSSSAHAERKETLGLQGLCDPVGNRVTLEFDKGSLYRITLPDVTSSSLVERCLNALRSILRKDIAMKVMVKWYGVRNAPGTQDLAPEQEWSMFTTLLFSLIGYDIDKLAYYDQNESPNEPTEVVSKKQRTSSDGSTDDWEYLLNTKLHKTIGDSLANVLKLQEVRSKQWKDCSSYIDNKNVMDTSESEGNSVQFNSTQLLFPYVIPVLYSLHLVYEENKLNTLQFEDLKPMAEFLYQLARDLKLDSYTTHYWKDFPLKHSLYYDHSDSQITEAHLKKISQPSYFNFEPPNVFQHLYALLKNEDNLGNYPYLTHVNTMSRDLVEIVGYICRGRAGGVSAVVSARSEAVAASSTPRARDHAPAADLRARHRRTVVMMCEKGITPDDIEHLPPSVSLLLLNELSRCKNDPPVDWPQEAYRLVMREDLAQQSDVSEKILSNSEYMETLAFSVLEKETAYSQCKSSEPEKGKAKGEESDIKTGMEHLDTKILRLLYPRDHRMVEVCNLLQSSIPVVINLTQRPEVSDHDFIEEQEKHLYAISTRTMALPIARGMLTLRTLPCIPTEPVAWPKLCVCGRGPPPRCNTIELGGGGETPPHCTLWPTFHNGVATGLSLVSMTGANIHSSWVVYNKPKGTTDMSIEHAGFLMALGLNGHLKDMAFMNIYEYLVKCQEMTSVGLLLGLAATYRGTMDVQATKMMSIHLEPLLPPTSIELDIHQNILVAALMGVGLIYQGTMHTHYAEVLLNEIGRPPGPEMENCVEREGYALAAGLALGLVCVGAHAAAPSHLAPHLRHYMLGGTKQPLAGVQKEKYKQGSFAVREGSTVNLDVTSPGATLALGLLYLRSGSTAVAEWLAAPRTHYLLDYVRPDLLMLRVIARGLILWDSIEPYEEWVESQVPDTIRPYCFVKPTEDNIDYEAMNQAYCNIVAGACFCIGLRFAGSGDEDARDCLMEYVNLFVSLGAKSVGELAGKSTIESCLNVILLSAGMVMCGRGDIAVLRACRRLRARVAAAAAPAHPPLTHGGQVAVHLTIGLLFAGGGRCTLSTSPTAVAALLAAFFPKFPTHSNDNRYHLQAFRHLYVLAMEPRLLLPRDIATGKLCYAHIEAVTRRGRVLSMRAPCVLPELHTLTHVRICDPRYWPIVFQRERNWEQLETFLEYSWCVDIKQRAGCLSYLEDPQGFLTLLAQTLTLDKNNIWSATADNIDAFSSDENIRNFTKHYLKSLETNATNNQTMKEQMCSDCHFLRFKKNKKGRAMEVMGGDGCQCRKYTQEEREFVQALSIVAYECIVKDMICVLPVWTTFLKILGSLKVDPSVYHIWQIKLLIAQIENHNQKYKSINKEEAENYPTNCEPLLSNEFALSIKQRVTNITDSWELNLLPHIKKYLGLPDYSNIASPNEVLQNILAAFIVFYDLPKGILHNIEKSNCNLLQCLIELDSSNLDVNAISKISSVIS